MKSRKIIIPVLGVTVTLLLSGVLFMAVTIAKAPDLSTVNASPKGYQSTILDDEGNVIRTLAGAQANRKYVTLDTIPDNLQNAFIAIEDSRFYDHHGIDPKSILRATYKGLTSGSFSEGASTITQQLLKNNVFTDWMSEDSFFDKVQRKIQEQYLAVVLEMEQSKEWILENYLNTINLGNGSWGVQVAADVYFNKDVSDLTLAESAMLAGITKNPTGYNPLVNPENAVERQQLVLSAMLTQEFITEDEYNNALEEDVLGTINLAQGSESDNIFSYFEDALLTDVKNDLVEELNISSEDAWNMIYSGGITIYSTMDSDIQEICENAALNGSYEDENQQVSLVVTDVSTGAVKAIVGGSGEKEGSLVLNRATESLRQPGSTLKIIGEYAAGINEGTITLGTVIDDAPTSYTGGSEIHNASYTFSGKTTIRQAITDSLNTVALKCYQDLGSSTVLSYIEKFGITTLTEDDNNEALALGGTSGGVTNLEMTSAYNAIANNGCYITPYYYTSVVDQDGNVILECEKTSWDVISSNTASLLTDAMKDVISQGTAASIDWQGLPAAAKTGTTTDMRDVWMIGYTPYYTLGIWGGYDDGQSQENSYYVKSMWKEVMSEIHSNYLYKDFAENTSLVTVEICTKCGLRAVSGLCDSTLQGDESEYEVFVSGTEPYGYCDCHIELTICETTGMKANRYCPSSETKSAVYLMSGTEGTEDADYVVPDLYEQVCSSHKSSWDNFWGMFASNDSEQTADARDDNNYSDYDHNNDYDHDDDYDHNSSDEGDYNFFNFFRW